jgi:uncharacterized protein (DUF2267 family)
MKHDEFIRQVQHRARLSSRGDAELATRATLTTYMVYVAIALAPWLAFLTARPRVHRQEAVQ